MSYAFDAQGRISGVTMGGQTVLSGAEYLPFGAVQSWIWANGQTYRRTHDTDARIVALTLGPDTATYGNGELDVRLRQPQSTDDGDAAAGRDAGLCLRR